MQRNCLSVKKLKNFFHIYLIIGAPHRRFHHGGRAHLGRHLVCGGERGPDYCRPATHSPQRTPAIGREFSGGAQPVRASQLEGLVLKCKINIIPDVQFYSTSIRNFNILYMNNYLYDHFIVPSGEKVPFFALGR